MALKLVLVQYEHPPCRAIVITSARRRPRRRPRSAFRGKTFIPEQSGIALVSRGSADHPFLDETSKELVCQYLDRVNVKLALSSI